MKDAFAQGFEAFYRGARRMANPYDYIGGHKMRDAWERGFIKAQREHERTQYALLNARLVTVN